MHREIMTIARTHAKRSARPAFLPRPPFVVVAALRRYPIARDRAHVGQRALCARLHAADEAAEQLIQETGTRRRRADRAAGEDNGENGTASNHVNPAAWQQRENAGRRLKLRA